MNCYEITIVVCLAVLSDDVCADRHVGVSSKIMFRTYVCLCCRESEEMEIVLSDDDDVDVTNNVGQQR